MNASSVYTSGESARSGPSVRRPRTSNTSKSRSVLTTTRNSIRRSIQRNGNNIKMEQISEVDIDFLVKEVTKLYVEAAARISRIVAESDANNESTDELPAVLLNELVRLDHSLICRNVQRHRERLLVRWTDTETGIIEQEHQKLVAAYHNEAPLQSALNACDEKTTFDEAWSIVKGPF